MANIREVARLAGVAVSTVSLAFNAPSRVSERTAARVHDAAETLGYRADPIASSLKNGRSRLIGMVLSDISNPFFSRLLRSMEGHANARDYLVVVADTDGDPARERMILEHLARQRAAAVLITPCGDDPASTAHVRELTMPTVLFDQQVEGLQFDFVGTDNVLASAMLTEHLLGLGHVRIGLLAGMSGQYTTRGRTRGYVDTLTKAGIEIEASLMLDAGYTGEGGYEQTMRMLTSDARPTALIASNNVTTLGALQAIRDLGRDCPGDISLVGIDEVPWMDMISPRITRVVQPIDAMAEAAVDLLLARLGREGSVKQRAGESTEATSPAAAGCTQDDSSPPPCDERAGSRLVGDRASACENTVRLFSPTLVPGTSTAAPRPAA